MLKPIRRESLVDHAVTTIHNYIIDEAMQPGEHLPPERQLAGALVISRMTLRTALAVLEGRGIIRRDHGKATVAASMAGSRHMGSSAKVRRDLARLMELRFAAEVGAAEYACRRRTDRQLARLRAVVERMAEDKLAGRPFNETDVHFHLLLLECAGEAFVGNFGEVVQEFFRLATLASPRLLARGQPERVVAEHRAMLDALRRRDADMLRALHLQGFRMRHEGIVADERSGAALRKPAAATRKRGSNRRLLVGGKVPATVIRKG